MCPDPASLSTPDLVSGLSTAISCWFDQDHPQYLGPVYSHTSLLRYGPHAPAGLCQLCLTSSGQRCADDGMDRWMDRELPNMEAM